MHTLVWSFFSNTVMLKGQQRIHICLLLHHKHSTRTSIRNYRSNVSVNTVQICITVSLLAHTIYLRFYSCNSKQLNQVSLPPQKPNSESQEMSSHVRIYTRWPLREPVGSILKKTQTLMAGVLRLYIKRRKKREVGLHISMPSKVPDSLRNMSQGI